MRAGCERPCAGHALMESSRWVQVNEGGLAEIVANGFLG